MLRSYPHELTTIYALTSEYFILFSLYSVVPSRGYAIRVSGDTAYCRRYADYGQTIWNEF